MSAHGAAPRGGTRGHGRISGNSRIVPFERHERHGIAGLFWTMPERWQRGRIRVLALTFLPETISAIVRRPFREVVAIIEGAS